jgi:hypothetical protein
MKIYKGVVLVFGSKCFFHLVVLGFVVFPSNKEELARFLFLDC